MTGVFSKQTPFPGSISAIVLGNALVLTLFSLLLGCYSPPMRVPLGKDINQQVAAKYSGVAQHEETPAAKIEAVSYQTPTNGSHQPPAATFATPLSVVDGEVGDTEAKPALLVNHPVEPSIHSIPNAEPKTSLQALIDQALAVHPSILAARQKVASLSNRVPQATSLDDPTLGNVFWPFQDQALQTAGGRVAHQFSLAQKVPWPEKLKARGAIAQRDVQIAIAGVARVEHEITETVCLAYYELWLTERLIEIVQDNKELVEELITIAEARYRTGGSQQDILRAELEGDKLEEQLIALRSQKEQARADLGTLVRQPLDLVPTSFVSIDIIQAPPQLDLLIAEAERCNPDLQGLAAEVARDRAKQSLACLQQYPDFQLGLGYSIISDNRNVISPVANGHDNISFSIGVSLPIWRDKINAGINEAAHQRSNSQHRREAQRDRMRGQLRRMVAAAYASMEQLKLFEDRLIPRTQQTLEIATADYRNKKAEFTVLIDTFRELLAYRAQVVRSQAALASTFAQIERAVGCELGSGQY